MVHKYLIILLNYNNWPDTIECIKSLIISGVQDSNILVIENCSNDDSYFKLNSEFPGIKIIRSKKNLGFTGGNNLGLKYAYENNYDYAIVLNNDTVVESRDSLNLLIKAMESNPDVSMATGRIFYYPQKNIIWYDGGRLIKWKASVVHYNYKKDINSVKLNDNLKNIDFISGCYMCIRLKDFSKIGYMNDNFFIYLDDLEYCARAIKNNLKLMYVPEAVIYHKAMGEEKRTPKMIYYTVRNRRLLIKLHFGTLTKFYFEIYLFFKKYFWFFTNRNYYEIVNQANKAYRSKYFGQIPDYIK